MRRTGKRLPRWSERGVVILLVAVVLLFVVGAMAVLAIDLVTFYTSRSEAQLAANGAALSGARALANSGMTSRPSDTTLTSAAQTLAETIAKQVAANNKVGGRFLNPNTEVVVSFPNQASTNFGSNPHINVRVLRNDLPTFFARIFGRTQVTVAASATAEAYNPSPANPAMNPTRPVAPTCVKPWLLPNLDPSPGGSTIFEPTTGAITNSGLVGWTDTNSPALFFARCQSCTSPFLQPNKWKYYPGAATDFPPPTQLPMCNFQLNNAYEQSVAGCVQTPISCNSTIHIDTLAHPNRNSQTAHAVNCLTHTLADKGDQVDDNPFINPGQPFRFVAGDNNPVAGATGQDVMVSGSLVTVPVFDSPNPPATFATNPVTVIGFVQLFLNPDGVKTPIIGPTQFRIKTTIVNLTGCGTNATGQAIIGNGGSAVPVRLITQ